MLEGYKCGKGGTYEQSYGVVGYHVCFTRKRSWVRTPVALFFNNLLHFLFTFTHTLLKILFLKITHHPQTICPYKTTYSP